MNNERIEDLLVGTVESKDKPKPNPKTIVDPNEMHFAKAKKLTIELQVQNDITRAKFHRQGRCVRWYDLTGCEQLEIIDALELALKEAKANAEIDRDNSDWAEKNKFVR